MSATVRPLFMLRIEIDGHHRGGAPVKPWVARILGPSAKFGLEREFVRPMNDWAKAHQAWSGNTYGVVATFPMRDGYLYEVQRAAGSSSKRHITRTFHWLDGGELAEEPVDIALRRVSGNAPGALLRVREWPERTLVTDLAETSPVAFSVVDGERLYWLREGHAYDVRDVGPRDAARARLLRVVDGAIEKQRVQSWPSQTLR